MEKAKKKEINMLSGPIWNQLILFAFPVAATAILEQLFNAADIAVIGRFTGSFGTVGMAAVGANVPIITLILNFFTGISLGANVVIANAIGMRDEKSASDSAHTAVIIALIGGIFMTALGEAIIEPSLRAMQVPGDTLKYAVLYMRIYLAGMPVILLYNIETAIFRSIGQTKIPLIALTLSGILNVFLNLFFVIVLHMTVNGVALATVISNVCSSALLFVFLCKSKTEVKISIKKLRVHKYSLKRILKIGVPAGLQGAVFAIANLLVQSSVNSLGTAAVAGSSAAGNVEAFCYFCIDSFAQACTTFIGQNYGAGNMQRCKKIFKISMLEDFVFYIIVGSVTLIFGRQILSVFNTDPTVISVGYTRLEYLIPSYTFSLVYLIMSGYMRGFGISVPPAVLTTIGICATRITWLMTVFPRHRNFSTIMAVYPISLGVTALLIFFALLKYNPARRQNILRD